MKVLILAGGYGTRLYPLIKDTPKALLQVAGKTLIDHTVDKFSGVPNIDELVLVTNAKFADMLTVWARERKGLAFPIRVINDGTHTPEERLGAVGDVLYVLAKERVHSDWVVAGSDNLFDFDIKNFFNFALGKAPHVTVGCYDLQDLAGAVKYGVIQLDGNGRMTSLEEKPARPRSSLISMCLYYFPSASLGLLRQYVEETHNADSTGGYLQWLYQKQPVFGLTFSGKWYDIGSVESYNEAQKVFQS
ncbi:MAG: nucleotidyltransferase family protein [Candidatus Omnitrophica bacterium]|nr:nucleotidyltransferase family protein [Candidatus Omnitrophota bacterium]